MTEFLNSILEPTDLVSLRRNHDMSIVMWNDPWHSQKKPLLDSEVNCHFVNFILEIRDREFRIWLWCHFRCLLDFWLDCTLSCKLTNRWQQQRCWLNWWRVKLKLLLFRLAVLLLIFFAHWGLKIWLNNYKKAIYIFYINANCLWFYFF